MQRCRTSIGEAVVGVGWLVAVGAPIRQGQREWAPKGPRRELGVSEERM